MTRKRAAVWPILFLILGFSQPGSAQRYQFSNYTAQDGLSQMVVESLFQDSKGYVWIGTQAGLNRFDGNRFEVFGTRHGLASDFVTAITEAADGTLWIGTRGGIARLPPARTTTFEIVNDLDGVWVSDMLFDAQGRLWCASNNGLSQWNGPQFQNFAVAQGLPGGPVHDLLLDHSGRLWAAGEMGLYFLDGDRFVPADTSRRPDESAYALAEDAAQRLWVVRDDGVSAHLGSQLMVHHAIDQLPRMELQQVILHADQHGVVWIGTEDGVVLLEDDAMTLISAKNGLPPFSVRAMLEDREGIIWLGGFGGVAQFLGRAFTNYTSQDGLGSDTTRPIMRDRQGRLWVGTSAGLSRFNGFEWVTFTTADGIGSDLVEALHEDASGRIWVGNSGLLSYFDGADFHPVDDDIRAVESIAEDQEGTLWFATDYSGVFTFDGDGFEPVQIPVQNLNDARLLIDSREQVWVSATTGLYRWDGDTWQTFTTDDGLAFSSVYFLSEDSAGNIWFGYHASYGVTRYDGKTFKTFTSADGLSNDAVFSIGARNDHVWFGTARGVDRFDGRSFVNYGPEEGYASFESNAGGFFADADDTLWFATAEGLSHYDPRFDHLLSLNHVAPDIASLTLGTQMRPAAGTFSVTHENNDLLASVAPLVYVGAKHVQFRYRLSNYDDDWRPLRGFEISYSKLPPGDYRLDVQGRFNQNDWSDSARASFSIQPAFWQTRWFRVMGGLTSLTLLGLLWIGGYRFRARRLQDIAVHLEAQVQERTNELSHANEELQQAMDHLTSTQADLVEAQKQASLGTLVLGVAHEINTPLGNAVALSSHLIKTIQDTISRDGLESPDPEDLAGIAKVTSKSGPMIMESLNRISTLINRFKQIGVTRERLPTREIDLQDWMKSIADTHGKTIRSAGHHFETRCPDGIRTELSVVALSQVIEQLVENSLQHGFDDRGGLIRIEVEQVVNGIVLRYLDNGRGVDEEMQKTLFDPFTTSRRGNQHVGLGLHLVHSMVLRVLRGEVHLLRVTEGFGIEIRLPLDRAQRTMTKGSTDR